MRSSWRNKRSTPPTQPPPPAPIRDDVSVGNSLGNENLMAELEVRRMSGDMTNEEFALRSRYHAAKGRHSLQQLKDYFVANTRRKKDLIKCSDGRLSELSIDYELIGRVEKRKLEMERQIALRIAEEEQQRAQREAEEEKRLREQERMERMAAWASSVEPSDPGITTRSGNTLVPASTRSRGSFETGTRNLQPVGFGDDWETVRNQSSSSSYPAEGSSALLPVSPPIPPLDGMDEGSGNDPMTDGMLQQMNGVPSPPPGVPPPHSGPPPPQTAGGTPPTPHYPIAGPSRPPHPMQQQRYPSASPSSSSTPPQPQPQPYSYYQYQPQPYRDEFIHQPNASGVYDYSPPPMMPRYQYQQQYYPQPYYPPTTYYPDQSQSPYPVYQPVNPYTQQQQHYSPQNPYAAGYPQQNYPTPSGGGYGYSPYPLPQGPGPGGGGWQPPHQPNGAPNNTNGYHPSPTTSHSSYAAPPPPPPQSSSPSPYPPPTVPPPPPSTHQPNPNASSYTPTKSRAPFYSGIIKTSAPPPPPSSGRAHDFLSPPLSPQILESLAVEHASASLTLSPRPSPQRRKSSHTSSRRASSTSSAGRTINGAVTLSGGVMLGRGLEMLVGGNGEGVKFGELEFGGEGLVPGPLVAGGEKEEEDEGAVVEEKAGKEGEVEEEKEEEDEGTGGLTSKYIFSPSRPLPSPSHPSPPGVTFNPASASSAEIEARGTWGGKVVKYKVAGERKREQERGVRVRGGKGRKGGLLFGDIGVEEVRDVRSRKVKVEKVEKVAEETIPTPIGPTTKEEQPQPASENPQPIPTPVSTTATPPTASPAPAVPSAKAAPKSWASLLRSSPAPTPSTPSAGKPTTALPITPGVSGSSINGSPASPILPASTSVTTPGTPSAGPSRPNAWAQQPGRIPSEELGRLLLEGVSAGGKGRAGSWPRGLVNTGNMCFANSILQVLAYCTPFTELFEELGKRLKADLGRRTPLIEAMVQFLQEFTPPTDAQPNGLPNGAANGINPALLPSLFPQHSRTASTASQGGKREPFVPEYVYDAMKENKRFDVMQRGHQEDAEEFLGFFLETLHEELLYIHARNQQRQKGGAAVPVAGQAKLPNGEEAEEREVERPVSPSQAEGGDGWLEVGKRQKASVVRNTESRESAISRIFGGKLRSVLHTPGQKDSVTLEPYQPLQLEISPSSVFTISDALLHLTQPEIIPGVFSSSRGVNVDATKQVYVETLPPILILHMKRFLYDTKEGRVVKKGKAVGYEVRMEVPVEVVSPARRGMGGLRYRLFGVVYHHGTSASGGHYTACVLRQNPASSVTTSPTTSWIHLDDESIEEVGDDQVVVSREQAEKGRNGTVGKGGRERCAYLCFYERVD